MFSESIFIFSITTATVHLSQPVIQVLVEINCNVMNVSQMDEPKLMRNKLVLIFSPFGESEFYLTEINVFNEKLHHAGFLSCQKWNAQLKGSDPVALKWLHVRIT